MATKYGYRLFTVKVHPGFGQTPKKFPDAKIGEELLQKTISEVCLALDGHTETEPLRYRDRTTVSPATPVAGREDTTPFVRLTHWAQNDRRFDFRFMHGRKGSHSTAMAARSDEDTELDEKAPSNEYRAFLYLPKAGDSAIFVAEARNQICPGEDLLRLLGVSSMRIDEARPETERVGWWRFVPKRVSDEVQLTQFLRNGSAAYLELTKYTVAPSGRRKQKSVRLRQDGLPSTKGQAMAKALIAKWSPLSAEEIGAEGKPPKGASDVLRVAALMDVKVSRDYYDDAGIGWEGVDGSTQFFSPTSLGDPFTYRVGSPGVRPTDVQLRQHAESTLGHLMEPLSIELDL